MTTQTMDMPQLLAIVASASSRPRYAFMILNLVAQASGEHCQAGPYIRTGTAEVPIREWLCDALTPMGQRDPKRIRMAERVKRELEQANQLPKDPVDATRLVNDVVRERVRAAGMSNVSRAVSELVRAGLLHRHYQGYAVNHENRGAQRMSVYAVLPEARHALSSGMVVAPQERDRAITAHSTFRQIPSRRAEAQYGLAL